MAVTTARFSSAPVSVFKHPGTLSSPSSSSSFSSAAGPVKSRKEYHEKSPNRDAEFMRIFRSAALSRSLGSVAFSIIRDDQLREAFRVEEAKRTGKMSGAVLTRWHEKLPISRVRRHRVPAPWRDLTNRLRAEFAHFQLFFLGDVYAFSLNLSSDIEAKARGKGAGAKRFLTDRISRRLKGKPPAKAAVRYAAFCRRG